ncbi:MAG: endonuclease/exonuclease/phosphatase family protein, partial [Magnetospiraceae bacterium]
MALKLATFNLYQFAAPGTFWYEEKARNSYTDADWAAKKDWIATRLAEMAADVVGFQEVFAVDALRDLCRAAGYAHFATVDTPQISPDNPRVFTAPVVALAARFPIQEAKAVGVDAAVKDQLPVEESFDFSRRPIRAVVDCPPHGPLVVVVAHLKSKRPIVPPPAFSDTADWDHKVQETLRATSRGHAAALLQRGAEAAALYHALTAQIATDPDMPIVVLGDLNDDPHSIPLEALTLSGPVHQIDGKAKADWPRAVRPALYTYRFYDAWILAAPKGAPRPPTHFHGGEGGVLDYILVSNPLNAKNPHHIARVGACEIFNAHLQNDGVGNHKQSDHGQVAVTLAIKDQTQPMAVAAAPARPQASSAERDRFLHAAGGVFASPVDFGYWESRDKYENFWAFFFDHDYGWVK